LTKSYQGFNLEGNQKYDDRDVISGSLVSCRSKDDVSGHEPLPG
jgi:hypothetical protein